MRNLQLGIKRLFDVVLSLAAILLLFMIPVFELVFIAIKVSSKGPALFFQKRIGKGQKPFQMYKFRTMILERYDAQGREILSENRITPVGRFLRKTSLDELPQLFNVLMGSMSLIGPRPMLDYQAEKCDETEKGRFLMRPGLTGLAQVKGRNNIPWTMRIPYDLEYVKNFSLWLDVKILFMSIAVVFQREGTDVNVDLRGADKFSKHYRPNGNDDHVPNE